MSRIVYGASRYRWGWVGWIYWPLSADGSHWTDSLRPFKWWALWRGRTMARNATGKTPVRATEEEQARREYDLRKSGLCDPKRFGSFRAWG